MPTRYGRVPVMLSADDASFNEVSPIRTGTIIDRLSGIGGIPRKKITEIWGTASVGKSSIMLQAVANAQKEGVKCGWVDVEFSYEAPYSASLGVQNGSLGLLQPGSAEEALDGIIDALEADFELIVLDSVGALLPQAELDKKVGEKTIGGQAALVSRFVRKVVPILAEKNAALVVINHGFTDIMTAAQKTSGGVKLEYAKSLSIHLKWKGDWIGTPPVKLGKVIYGYVKKNKIAPTEGMELKSTIMFGEGFSQGADILDEAIERKVITKQGNTHFFEGEKLGLISKVRELMKDEKFAARVKAKL